MTEILEHNGTKFKIFFTSADSVRVEFPELQKQVDFTFEYLVDSALYQLASARG